MRRYTVQTKTNDTHHFNAEEMMTSGGAVLFIGSQDENIALFPLSEVLSVTSDAVEEETE